MGKFPDLARRIQTNTSYLGKLNLNYKVPISYAYLGTYPTSNICCEDYQSLQYLGSPCLHRASMLGFYIYMFISYVAFNINFKCLPSCRLEMRKR